MLEFLLDDCGPPALAGSIRNHRHHLSGIRGQNECHLNHPAIDSGERLAGSWYFDQQRRVTDLVEIERHRKPVGGCRAAGWIEVGAHLDDDAVRIGAVVGKGCGDVEWAAFTAQKLEPGQGR